MKGNKINMDIINKFVSQFKVGTIYMVMRKIEGEDQYDTKYEFENFVYCRDIGNRFIGGSLIYVYGRNVLVNIINTDESINHKYTTILNCDGYHVPNTSYFIKYDSINNYIIHKDREDFKKYCFVPVYTLNEIEQAYFIVGEDQYDKDNEKEI